MYLIHKYIPCSVDAGASPFQSDEENFINIEGLKQNKKQNYGVELFVVLDYSIYDAYVPNTILHN